MRLGIIEDRKGERLGFILDGMLHDREGNPIRRVTGEERLSELARELQTKMRRTDLLIV